MSFGLMSRRIRFHTPPPPPLPQLIQLVFHDTDFFFFFFKHAPLGVQGGSLGPHPPGLGLHLPLLCSAGGFPETLAPRAPHPWKPEGERVGAGEKKGDGREGGRREGLREVPGRRDERAGEAVHLFQARGLLREGKPAGRPPHPLPRPGEPRPRRAVHPSAPPDNALQLPASEGRPAREMPGHGRPEGAGAQRPGRASTSHLSDARPGPPHMDLYNLTSPRPRAAGRSRSRR